MSNLVYICLKQNAEWSFDSMQQATALGFNIDPLKVRDQLGT